MSWHKMVMTCNCTYIECSEVSLSVILFSQHNYMCIKISNTVFSLYNNMIYVNIIYIHMYMYIYYLVGGFTPPEKILVILDHHPNYWGT